MAEKFIRECESYAGCQLPDHLVESLSGMLTHAAEPERGWKLVPIDPDQNMSIAGQLVPNGIGGCPPSWQTIWRDMIAAAPIK